MATHAHLRLAGPGRWAFSLIELLLVISIVALLLGILLPALQAARRSGRTLHGLANLSQIGRGLAAYVIDNDNALPIGWRQDGGALDTNWTTALNGHFMGTGMTDATMDVNRFSEIFKDPNASVDDGRVHYAGHPVMMPDLTRTTLPAYKMQRLNRPAQVLMVMDSCQIPPSYNSNATAWSLDNLGLWDATPNPIYFDPADADNGDPIDPGPDVDDVAGQGHIRWRQHHGGAANFLYSDGHALTQRVGEITKANIRTDE